jgi:hypothetical protein
MELTQPYVELNKDVVGYMLNSPLSPKNQLIIRDLQEKLENTFGDIIWSLPAKSLHITLMDWVAPLVDYDQDKDRLFREIFDKYDQTFRETTQGVHLIRVTFSEVHVSSGGIYITGTDEGQFDYIRNNFLEKIELLPGTKRPPSIIHTTIARFTSATNLKPIQEFIGGELIQFEQLIDEFVLVRETKIPMLKHEIIETYPLPK